MCGSVGIARTIVQGEWSGVITFVSCTVVVDDFVGLVVVFTSPIYSRV